MLARETFVRLLSKEDGFSRVQLADGRAGYVATEDLRPASAAGRAVANAELFPERAVELAPHVPESDFSMPVSEIPAREKANEPSS